MSAERRPPAAAAISDGPPALHRVCDVIFAGDDNTFLALSEVRRRPVGGGARELRRCTARVRPARSSRLRQARQGSPPPPCAPRQEWYWCQLVEAKPFRSAYAPGPQPLIAGHPPTRPAAPLKPAPAAPLAPPPRRGSRPRTRPTPRPRAASGTNLSQTAREQCELEGLVADAASLAAPGPGQEVLLRGLVARKGAPRGARCAASMRARACQRNRCARRAARAADLNGARARVLPTTGRGAPQGGLTPPGRVALRLGGSRGEIAVKPENFAPAHGAAHTPGGTAGGGTAAGAEAGGGAAGGGAAAGAAAPQGALGALIHADIRRGRVPPLIKSSELLKAGLPGALLACGNGSCGARDQEGFGARAAPFGSRRAWMRTACPCALPTHVS